MAWYDTGTVSVTNGSTTVTGSGTNFIAGAQIGEAFYGPDDNLYEIQAIVSATEITLADLYLGATQTGQAYKIVPTQSLVADLTTQVSSLISDFQSVKDEAGEGKFDDGTAASAGITFNLDQDTGFFRPAANQIGFTAAGVQRALLTSTGLDVTGDVTLGDNDKAIFGAGSDLQIYHDGSHSVINDVGTGHLKIQGTDIRIQSSNGAENFLVADENGAVRLYNDNSQKFQTTSTGVNVTGTVAMDGGSTSADFTFGDNNKAIFGAGSDLQIYHNTHSYIEDAGGGDLILKASDQIKLQNGSGQNMAIFNENGAVILTHSEATKLTTTATGIDVTGTITSDVSTTGDFNFYATSDGGGAFRIYPDDATTANPTWQYQSNSSEDQAWVIGGVERMRIDSNGDVGIGTNSPDSTLHLSGVSAQLRIESSSGNSQINFADTADANVGILAYDHSVNAMTFRANDSERMRIDSGGRAIIPAGVTLGTSAGVYNAANTLNDYEEGTWTPVISDGTNDATSNIAVGTYTKVGNLVHVQGRIVLSSLGSVSGAVQLKGLPFNSKALSNNFGVLVVGRASLLNRPAGLKVSGDLRSNVDYVNLILNDTNSGTSNMQSTEFTDDGDIAFSMQYITA